MLGKNKSETYYVVSSHYNTVERKLITTLIETNGDEFFDFIASYEKILDNELTAAIKKVKGYSFTATELKDLKQKLAAATIESVNSILTENNLPLSDIDFIGLEHLNIADDFQLNISTLIYDHFKLPVIFNLKLDDKNSFLKLLANNKGVNDGLIIHLDENFDIFKLNNSVSHIDQSMGFSVLRYLALYSNINPDKISYLISQGEVDEAIINKLSTIENLESLQKELINLLVFSKLNTEDKLRTAFFTIKSLLLKNLAEFDNNTPIMLIGNTCTVELINQAIQEKFENIRFLKNQSQRQNSFNCEQLAYLACKKYTVEDYNNGVKLS